MVVIRVGNWTETFACCMKRIRFVFPSEVRVVVACIKFLQQIYDLDNNQGMEIFVLHYPSMVSNVRSLSMFSMSYNIFLNVLGEKFMV